MTYTETGNAIETGAKLNRMAGELIAMKARRADMLFAINTSPDGQSITDRQNGVLILNRQIDRLTVAHGIVWQELSALIA
jgi:hypothetical protein